MAAIRPIAVAISASDMPGATTARLADPFAPMPLNEFIMPHTVPKRPINGVVLPVVARNETALSILLISMDIAFFNALWMLSISPIKNWASSLFCALACKSSL